MVNVNPRSELKEPMYEDPHRDWMLTKRRWVRMTPMTPEERAPTGRDPGKPSSWKQEAPPSREE